MIIKHEPHQRPGPLPTLNDGVVISIYELAPAHTWTPDDRQKQRSVPHRVLDGPIDITINRCCTQVRDNVCPCALREVMRSPRGGRILHRTRALVDPVGTLISRPSKRRSGIDGLCFAAIGYHHDCVLRPPEIKHIPIGHVEAVQVASSHVSKS